MKNDHTKGLSEPAPKAKSVALTGASIEAELGTLIQSHHTGRGRLRPMRNARSELGLDLRHTFPPELKAKALLERFHRRLTQATDRAQTQAQTVVRS